MTSDKCYENPGEASRRFVEGDPLGGDDPYSSSKACAELVTAAYRRSFFSGEDSPRVATARAGNVIGGGDWGEDRLLGDIVRASAGGEPVRVRNPEAVRPWQHVLNPLSGYLLLAEELWRSQEVAASVELRAARRRRADGPLDRRATAALWGGAFAWELDESANPPEAGHLALDSGAAERSWAGARNGIWGRRWSASSSGTRPSAGARTCGG